jgi:hypothetical protein
VNRSTLGGLLVLIVFVAAGCGGGSRSSETEAETTATNDAAAPLRARLVRNGYTLDDRVATALLRPRPTGWFLVRDVDWAATGNTSFSVAVQS